MVLTRFRVRVTSNPNLRGGAGGGGCRSELWANVRALKAPLPFSDVPSPPTRNSQRHHVAT